MVCELTACIANAGTLVLAYRFEAGVVLEAFAAHRPAYTVGPSTAFMALAAHGRHPDHFASFRLISSGGAPCRPRSWRSFARASARTSATATGSPSAPPPAPRSRPSARPRRPGLRHALRRRARASDTVVRILDEEGREVPFGEQGEIAVRGPQVVSGYWNLPEATAAAFPDGELRTGDIGFMDAAGWLYVVDRKKDMINASGFKVWPREVEDVLYTTRRCGRRPSSACPTPTGETVGRT